LLPIAFKLAESTKQKIQVDIFYGLFRMQFPTAKNEFVLVQNGSLIREINQSIITNIISAKWKEKIPMIIEALNLLASNFKGFS
jgi:hypothetical protein